MTTTDLVNRSLRHAKQNIVESIDDRTEQAIYCKSNIQFMIDEVLQQHEWGFARKRASLLLLPNVTFANWLYAFDMPDDMIQLHFLVLPLVDHRQNHLWEEQYEIFENTETADRATGRIATNEPELDMVYTKKIEIVEHLPYYFADAVSYLLGYHLADTFGGTERAGILFQMFNQQALPKAIARDRQVGRQSLRGLNTFTSDGVLDSWKLR
jgi:hypothetical protein